MLGKEKLTAHYVLFIASLSLLLLNFQDKENISAIIGHSKHTERKSIPFFLKLSKRQSSFSALHAILGRSVPTKSYLFFLFVCFQLSAEFQTP